MSNASIISLAFKKSAGFKTSRVFFVVNNGTSREDFVELINDYSEDLDLRTVRMVQELHGPVQRNDVLHDLTELFAE